MEASFRIGHDASTDVLFLAIDVRDESAVHPTPADLRWNAADGVEIYLDLEHGDESSGVQHLLRINETVRSLRR